MVLTQPLSRVKKAVQNNRKRLTRLIFLSFLVSFGAVKIFDHFLKVTDLLGGMPTVLQTIAQDVVDDIRRLLNEAEKLGQKHSVTGEALREIGNAMNISKASDELIPELEKILKDNDLVKTIKEIAGYLDFDRVRNELLPELEKVLKENDVPELLEEIRYFLNVTVISDVLLPEIDRFVINCVRY